METFPRNCDGQVENHLVVFLTESIGGETVVGGGGVGEEWPFAHEVRMPGGQGRESVLSREEWRRVTGGLVRLLASQGDFPAVA